MRKTIMMFMILAPVVYAAGEGTAELCRADNTRTILSLATGAFVTACLQQVSPETVSPTAVKVAQLSTVLATAGVMAQKPGLRHAAIATPLIVALANFVEMKEVREIAYKLPMGIGEALEGTGERVTTALLSVASYVYLGMPLLDRVLFRTKLGNKILGISD